MNIGNLIKVRKTNVYGGQIGIVTGTIKHSGFVRQYIIRVPTLGYSLRLSRQQFEVIA